MGGRPASGESLRPRRPTPRRCPACAASLRTEASARRKRLRRQGDAQHPALAAVAAANMGPRAALLEGLHGRTLVVALARQTVAAWRSAPGYAAAVGIHDSAWLAADDGGGWCSPRPPRR